MSAISPATAFAGGMLDTWNLQSLGPMTAISAGKIYGLSWGNQASSTVFDNSQSATPVIAFLRRRARCISPVTGRVAERPELRHGQP
ncbi:CFA/I fimbrial subunit C usher protein [Klebsiella pneumoniae]|uniref:CFA/I fimbrial subunit C usher protein n=1 Tax=Klebsiella pneumoniae TaxID=573 RepID=A0A3S4HXW5_KLEPN|nr:CFA/I fimbrial subunit C usher protein [Klebsiella pneumoniae]